MSHQKKLAILVGGGPAPGINSVIGAATIRGALEGVEVLGIRDGFEWIMQGNVDHVIPLTIEEVSRIHFRGGSHIGISRANPTQDPQHLENTVISLLRLDVSQLITIGGDDTAFSAMKLAEKASGRIQVAHVPKTIDNDLDLPAYVDTFGFQTARHIGVDIVQEPDGGRADHLALVLRGRDGAEGRPPRPRHRQGGGGHPHPDPRGVRRAAGQAQDDRGHARGRGHQAPELRPARRGGGDRGGPRARDRPRGPGRPRATWSATPTATCASRR